jgi:hypothetical protein
MRSFIVKDDFFPWHLCRGRIGLCPNFRSSKVVVLEEAVEFSTLILAAENTPIVDCDISPHS